MALPPQPQIHRANAPGRYGTQHAVARAQRFKFVRIGSHNVNQMTDEQLVAQGSSRILTMFAFVKVVPPQAFVSWAVRIALILLANIDAHPLEKKHKVNYYFEQHIEVVVLAMATGLPAQGCVVVPVCDLVRATFPDSRALNHMGSSPSWRSHTLKHIKAVLGRQSREEVQRLSSTIARLGLFRMS